MSWTNLPTNFKNLIWSGLKKYRQYTNQDNTISFEDVTEYVDTEGTQMSAAQLNQMTGAINDLMNGVAPHDTFKISGTVSASNYTLTDSRINDNHWEVESIYFATPANVTSQIHWTTNITNHTVSLSATYAGSTNVIVKMHWVQ